MPRCLRGNCISVPDYPPIQALDIGPCCSPNKALALPPFCCGRYTIRIVFWYVPPHLRQVIHRLDLFTPLTLEVNVDEVQTFLNNIDRVNWDTILADNIPDGTPARHDHSPGRSSPTTGNVVYYDPWDVTSTSRAHALALRDVLRSVQKGHPVGFMFSDDWHRL